MRSTKGVVVDRRRFTSTVVTIDNAFEFFLLFLILFFLTFCQIT